MISSIIMAEQEPKRRKLFGKVIGEPIPEEPPKILKIFGKQIIISNETNTVREFNPYSDLLRLQSNQK